MTEPTRRGPGGGPGPRKSIELAGIDEAKSTAHDPSRCATCLGFVPWTTERRDQALTYALTAKRRICDLQDVR